MSALTLVLITIIMVLLCIILIYSIIEDGAKRKNHTIEYDYEYRQLIIDGTFVAACFRNGSLNHELFEYLNKNKNKLVSYAELESSVFRGRAVDLNKVIDAMGFKSDLKRLLFSFDAHNITYHPEKLERHDGIISLK
jgi:hypothetical protein